MGVKVQVGGYVYECAGYTVNEDATPLSAGDSSGSVGTFDLSLVLPDPNHTRTVNSWTNLFTNPRFETLATASVESNYAPNPSAETNTTGFFSQAGGGTVSITSAAPSTTTGYGTKVAKSTWTVAATGAGGGLGYYFEMAAAGLVPGDTISVGVYHAKASISKTMRLRVAFLNVGVFVSQVVGNDISFAAGTIYSAATTSDLKLEGLVIPATATRVYMYIEGNAGTAWGIGDYFEMDGIMVNGGATALTYFDGETTDTADYNYAWTGTANASASTRTVIPVVTQYRNYVSNPSAETNTTGYTAGPGTSGVAALTSAAPSTTTAYGTKVLKCTWSVASTAASGAGVYYDINIAAAGIAVGDVISMALYHVKSSINNRLRTKVEFRTVGDVFISAVNGTEFQVTAGTIYTATSTAALKQENITVPVTTAVIRVYLSSVSGTGYANWSIGSYLELDGLIVNNGATALTYFDGATADTADLDYAWVGTANASVSTLTVSRVAGVTTTSAYRSSEWSGDTGSTYSLYVPTGGTATVAVAAPSTALVIARNAGQTVTLGASNETSVTTNETLLVDGSGTLSLGAGWWDLLTIVVGVYNGLPFSGSTTYASSLTSWSGTVDASTSYRSTVEPVTAYGPEYLVGEDVRLDDTRQGFTLGTVTGCDVDEGSALITLHCLSRLSELNVFNVDAQPFVGTLEQAFEYYVGLAGITTGLLVDDEIASTPVVFPGFTGELWFRLKQMAVALDCDISLVSGIILLRPIRTRVAERGRDLERSSSSGQGSLAQSVEVYWYDSQEITDELVYPPGGWNPDVEVLNVNAGETAEYQLELSASVSAIDAPVMTTFVAEDEDSASVYTIVADDGLPVDPTLWTANGGSVAVAINADTATLTVSLVGATDIPVATGGTSKAFSLALASDDSGSRYSTLRIIGTGVSYTRTLRTFRTGVSESRTATLVGETIDNPFLTDFESVMRAGVRAAKRWTGLVPSLSGTITAINRRGDSGVVVYPTYGEIQTLLDTALVTFTYATVETYYVTTQSLATYGDVRDYWFAFVASDYSNQSFGNVAGARIWDRTRRRWYRIRSGSLTPGSIAFSQADDDLLHSDVEPLYAAMTYAEVEALKVDFSYQQDYLAGAYSG